MPAYFDFGREYGYTRPRMVLSALEAGNIRDDGTARLRLLEELGIPEQDFHLAVQSHSKIVVPVSGLPKDPEFRCDGLYVHESDGAAAVTAADCVPLFLFEPEGNTAAVLHSGWKGTGILRNAVQLLKKNTGLAASDLHLIIGPSIRSCCYEVDHERAVLFASLWGEETVRKEEGRFYLDLARANTGIAENLCIAVIHTVDACTVCGKNLGSYRRQGSTYTKMAAITGFF